MGGRGSQQEAAKLFREKCCWADAAIPYFKEGKDLASTLSSRSGED